MKEYLDADFLLHSDTAKHLYHKYAAAMPIFDYHCHLTAKEIFENRAHTSITELWLGGDHYKWRVMRANGIDERYITGNATEFEKFLAFAETMPNLIGNPIHHWTHMELRRYFGVDAVLSKDTAAQIYKQVSDYLSENQLTPQKIIQSSNVKTLFTTDDPIDNLEFHDHLSKTSEFTTDVFPTWRPDAVLTIENQGWKAYVHQLEDATNTRITDISSLKAALSLRMDVFARHGCLASDHGLQNLEFKPATEEEANKIVVSALASSHAIEQELADQYRTHMLLWLAEQYHSRSWVMQLHIGALRSCNTRMVAALGEATGYDSIADQACATSLAGFFDALDVQRKLPKTVLFNLNETKNTVFATMLGNFQEGPMPSKMQFGTAWWFQDHLLGMKQQMSVFATHGVFPHFIGMVTDSRSFLSYVRHEYFRRILCNLIAEWVERGLYPYHEEVLANHVQNICYYNAKKYFMPNGGN